MNIGKQIRLNRLFAHPSGRLCSVAVDHWLGYGEGLPPGLRHIKTTLAAVMEAAPDAITMHKGMADHAWQPYAGKVPLIVQSTMARSDNSAREQIVTPDEAIRLGADAIAVAAFIRGGTEGEALKAVTDIVRDAARFELPVICHIYPRRFNADGSVSICYEPEEIAWAARCAIEAGADVVKTPYCGDVESHRQIVEDSPVPVVAAGGPKTGSLEEALQSMAEVCQAGAVGATIGRNIWGFPNITANTLAFKYVIHDNLSPDAAMRKAGLR